MSGDLTSRQVLHDEREVRRAMGSLPVRVPPDDLRTKLRVIGSRESARRRSRSSLRAIYNEAVEKTRLSIHNMMRPLAIPTAGGFLSAVLLFGVIAPTLAVPGASVAAASGVDVPTGLYTEASVRWYTSVDFTDEDFDVELTVDGQGRIIDYTIPDAQHAKTPAVRRMLENNLLFTQFYPATSFGQPTTGKIRLSFRSSRIDVKG